MLEFVIVYIVIVISIFINEVFKIKNGKVGEWLLIFLVSIFSARIVGLRPLNAGFDTVRYVTYFTSLQNHSFEWFKNVYSYNWSGDYLYRLWNYLLSYINVGAEGFLYITAALSIFLFILALRKLAGKDYLLIFLIFYAFPGFVQLFGNAIRQGFSLPFFLFSIAYFYKSKNIKLLICVVLTLLLHNATGIILIVFLMIMKFFSGFIKRHKIILFFFLLFIQPIMYLIIESITRISFFNRYSSYVIYEGTKYFFHYSFVLFLLLYIMYMLNSKLRSDKDIFLFTGYIVITILTSMFWFNSTTFGRIVYLGFPFLSIYLNNIRYIYNKKIATFLLIILALGIGIYFFNSPATQSMLLN